MIGVAAAVLLGLAVGAESADWVSIVKASTKMVPRVEILEDGKNDPSICSGVVIHANPGYLLTAAHCLSADRPISVTVNGRHADVIKVNRILDVAVLKAKLKGESVMTLAPETPPIGTEVAVLGFGYGVEKLAVQFGRVSQPKNEETKTLWVNVQMLSGNSGGPVIDAQGRLVGMSSRVYYSPASQMGAAIPVDVLLEFLEDYLPGGKETLKK